ncbi:globin [Niabella ginsenosidivorans]|uniref:Globin n=1 Tax=Niabella ginsenosidivorans TaxID=1176587 RepID=A0A1A9I3X2_9BACT|nr:group III truncated hemoglobin [Niabella ginsenosidivorans]ANH82015.1 globin [Niabella ginsenosidivorans]
MTEKKDITTIEDIRLLVDTFYGKVRADVLIGPIFNRVITDRWPEHLEKMYRFWQTVLLGKHTYFGSPFPPHARLPVEQKHFDRWLKLWQETLNELYTGPVVEEALWRSGKMAVMFLSKIAYYRGSAEKPLV